MTTEVIAVACHKGGSSKTTTAVNLSAGLARASWRVLLVDCDPQANATSMFADEEDIELDLFDVIKSEANVEQAIRPTRIPALDLLPSSLALARLDQELVAMHRREEKVREALDPVLGRYDAVILDMSPNLGALVIAALSAASSLIVPTDASKWGRRGVAMFLEWSEDLRRAKVLTADLLGVLLTRYESGTRIGREIRGELDQSELPVFATVIPKRTGAERMVTNQLVVGDPDAEPDLAEAYGQFTLEVIERVNACRAARGRHSRASA